MSTTLRHDPDRQTIELGGVSFLENDRCLVEAMREVGLRSHALKSRISKRVGVWDGKDLVISKPLKPPDRESQRRSILPRLWDQVYSSRVQAFLLRVCSSFRLFQTFADINKKGEVDGGLGKETLRLKGEDDLNGSATDSILLDEVTKLAAQHPVLQKLDAITGIDISTAPKDAKPISIVEGNWRLPNRMLKISEAYVTLKSSVKRIMPGSDGKWQIHGLEPQGEQENGMKTHEEEFDYVIVTTPFETNNIELDPPSIYAPSQSSQVFVERHITYFACKRRLAPGYFNQPADSTLPEDIFTSLNTTSEDFLISVTIEDEVNAAELTCVRDYSYFLYKATTTRAMSNHDITALFGEEELATLMSTKISNGVTIKDADMDWVHRQAWPHVGLISAQEHLSGNTETARNLYYLPAGLQAPSTMEKSCQLGRKVAKELFHGKLKKAEEMEP